MTDLSQLREKIDAVDAQLTALLKERMALSADVAECKAAAGIAVCDPARETAILEKVAAVCPEAVPVYRAILEASRAKQQEILNTK